jgi:hypothetical protein
MKNILFFSLQMIFVAALSSLMVLSGCSRTNSGTDPSPSGGEIVFTYNVELYVSGPGETSSNPLWWDKGSTEVGVKVTFKANPDIPVSGVNVDFIVSGGGTFWDYNNGYQYGTVAKVETNDNGIALLYFVTKGETVPTTIWVQVSPGVWQQQTFDKPYFSNQYVVVNVDESKIGNKYNNSKTTTIFINGPAVE